MGTVPGAVRSPGDAGEALAMARAGLGFLAGVDAAVMSGQALGEILEGLEQVGSVEAAARGRFLAAFGCSDGPAGWGQRTWKSWVLNHLRVTRGQAGEYQGLLRLARECPVLAGLLGEAMVPRSVAVQAAKWLTAVPEEFRGEAEQIVAAAIRAGADLRTIAQIIAEIAARLAPPDEDEPGLPDCGVDLRTTMDGAGVMHGDLSPECMAMVTAVLDALSAPAGAGDVRTQPERYHEALKEAMRRLLASDLLPQRAGAPVKANVHIHLAQIRGMDGASLLETAWQENARAQWAARRAGDSIAKGDGGAWLDGAAATAVLDDAMTVPVVFGDVDVVALQDLIVTCAEYQHLLDQHQHDSTATQGSTTADAAGGQDAVDSTAAADAGQVGQVGQAGQAGQAGPDAGVAGRLGELEMRILGYVLDVVSGPGGVASFLRRNLLGKGLNGPSLPLDVGRTDEIPAHLRRLVSLRDEGRCQWAGGCGQPAVACEPHHVSHRADGGHTSLNNLKTYCWWHHNVVFHRMGWQVSVHPDATSQTRSPAGRVIRSHSPPARPG